ncbi:MAG: HEPN domain-containing protein [Bryobacteraceae bacterium]
MHTALNNLKSSLSRVRDIADDVDRHASQALSDAALRARDETIECALAVILSGFLESFLRETAEELITIISSRCIPFQDLPERIKSTHFAEGGAVLARQAGEERRARAVRMTESEDTVRRLASVLDPSYQLLWEAFADTRSNPGPQTISEFLGRFAVEDCWKKLAASTGLSENTLHISLKSFLKVRHECAHTGRASVVPTPGDIRGHCDLLERLACGIVQVLEDRLEQPPLGSGVAAPSVGAPVPAR